MRNFIVLFLSFILIIIMAYQLNQLTITTLNYFPIDSEATFSKTATKLTVNRSDNERSILTWEIVSSHELNSYLNQDVGLLFKDGQLVSVQSKWSQTTSQLSQKTDLLALPNSLYQAISYHYLELHHPASQIMSANQMSTAQLYVTDSDSFQTPNTKQEKMVADKLINNTNKILEKNWSELIDYYQIDPNLYYQIPLIKLTQYQKTPLPGLTEADSNRVIAQLWEGLYKNYLLRIREQQINGGFMPLILLAKNHQHLYVLFTDDQGNYEQLIQKLNIN
ncbi:MAG TPA: hypothetical protein GXZ58_04485 [Bacilli bacterium]|nr:hypothetical protein [Bacilli bacterium]